MLEMSKITRRSDEETAGLIVTGRSSHSAPPSDALKSTLVKGLVLLLVGVLLLIATDSIGIQRVRSSDGVNDVASSANHTMDGVVQGKERPTTSETQPTIGAPLPSPPSSAPVAISNPDPSPISSSTGSNSGHDATSPQTPDPPPPSPSSMESSSRHTYQRRGQPLSDDEHQTLIDQWGSWTLVDPKRDSRPKEDFYASYPNRDVPRSKFPSTAWQVDKDYLEEFFPQALGLVRRAQEAIVAEYGNGGGKGEDGSAVSFEERSSMFRVEIMDTWDEEGQSIDSKRASTKQGGFSNRKSWDGFVRRVLHSIMTEDSFVFAMGGHSAAAGHGNHFVQSYTLQVQWILEAVFARLGVRHQARNFGMGGLGTAHNGLAAGSIYGPDVDVLMWDSSMTEKDDPNQDLLHRQYILGGGKVPILWSLALSSIKHLHLHADADVGYPGEGMEGIPTANSMEELNALPWATRYINCHSDLKKICKDHEYSGTCWVERDDYTPTHEQSKAPGGRASWHPGNRRHQLRGRVLAFTILSALHDALTLWNEVEGYEIPDEAWHVTKHYETIRTKVAADRGACHDGLSQKHLEFACKYPVKARTQFTPRAFPSWTNIVDILSPEQQSLLNAPGKNVYDAPDVFNPHLHPPKGSVDVLNIVEGGIPFESVLVPDYTGVYKMPSFPAKPRLPVGKGLVLFTKAGDPFCDGSADSFCSRGATDGCLLSGHNDGRNGIAFDGYSGWIVMNLPDVKHGYIAVKYHSWHKANGVWKTDGWNSINNERSPQTTIPPDEGNSKGFSNSTRALKKAKPAPFCEGFQFEYAIDGNITTLGLQEWQERSYSVQRVVEVLTLLEDPSYTNGEERQVEIAIRITGCAREKHFQLTHVYWS